VRAAGGRRPAGRALCLAFGLLLAAVGCPTLAGTPRHVRIGALIHVVRTGKGVMITLAPSLRRAVRRYFPGYRLARRADFSSEEVGEVGDEPSPFACEGDFDGNGLTDSALLLKNNHRQWVIIALHQQPGGFFRPYRLEHWYQPRNRRYGSCFFVRRHGPGRVGYLYTANRGVREGSMHLRHDGIDVWPPEEAGGLYYFERGGYRYVAFD
jgi:hypothetical protein